MEPTMRVCPGCGLAMPAGDRVYDGGYHASPECWSVFGEVLATEFQNAVLFGQIHQLTVDTYAVQHAGGEHRDKSVCVHLVGLHLVFERAVAPVEVPRHLQRLADAVTAWPHLSPPTDRGPLTVFDVAMAESMREHASRVREWATQLWSVWSQHHPAVAELAERCCAR